MWALEVANILLTAEKRGRLNATKRREIARALGDLGVIEQPQPQDVIFGDVLELASAHRLSSYDAAYLELAKRLQLPLATLDKALREASIAEGVTVLSPPKGQQARVFAAESAAFHRLASCQLLLFPEGKQRLA